MITKKSVIKSLIESFAAIVDHNNDEDVARVNEIIAKWRSMPATEVIAEAESVFGFTKIDGKGMAY